MSLKLRIFKDRLFTAGAQASIALLVLALLVVLGPIFSRGFSAVVFKGTSEFRRLQYDSYGRGNKESVHTEREAAAKLICEIYDELAQFGAAIDTDALEDGAKDIYRDYGRELRLKDADSDEYGRLRDKAKDLRDKFIDSLEADSPEEAKSAIDEILASRTDADFAGSCFEQFFALAANYGRICGRVDFSRKDEYRKSLAEVQRITAMLYGPDPRLEQPPLIMEQYGATRKDMADKALNELLYKTVWEAESGSDVLAKRFVSRKEDFAGTPLESFFDKLPEKTEAIMSPRTTIYWQYFIDDSTPGHYFGGVGPEIIGTLLLTLVAMLIAVPLGVTAAAYLVECAGETLSVRIIRGFVNTLAGVPSIVFGLFGLAFFVMVLLPAFGADGTPCILTAAMTLAVLVLPVIIRSSEEAIRAVPRSYKEASLALGAGNLRTFILVTLPAAMPGILTGIILSLSRAAGETAPILFTGAVALGPLPKSIFSQTRTLSYGSYDIAVGDRLAMMVPHKQYGMVATLIVLVLLLNLIAILIRSKMSARLKGI
ncbi:MAG: phosphate ABC transporter permease PstA [Phycisphaerae bacterium]|jgi:phosphate transport system permease protein